MQPAPSRLAVTLALALLLAAPARAVEVTWFAGDGSWNMAGNWFPFQVPAANDTVWVKANDVPLTVTYVNHTNPLHWEVFLDSHLAGTLSFVQHDHVLDSVKLNLGFTGVGATYSNDGGHTSVAGDFVLGWWGGSKGRYNLSGTGSVWANKETIGFGGVGHFDHSGGTHTVNANLTLGMLGGSWGRYDLADATVTTPYLGVGNGGVGRFNHFSGSTQVGGDINIGTLGGADGRYELTTGTVDANRLYVGPAGYAHYVQRDGTTKITDTVVIGGLGSGNGTITLDAGKLSSAALYVGGFGTGRVFQSGGTHISWTPMFVGQLGGSWGLYELSGGTLAAHAAFIGSLGMGTVTQTGGANNVTTELNLGQWGSGRGYYNLSGGSLSSQIAYLGGFGRGFFTQTGGENSVAGTLFLGYWPGSWGHYTLSGGELSVGHVTLSDKGRFDYTGGAITSGSFHNAGGTLVVSGAGTRPFPAAFTNDGTLTVSATEADFAQGATNGGAYFSNGGATSRFTNLSVGPHGFLNAAEGDRYVLTGDLTSTSHRTDWWNTSDAELVFEGGGSHTLSVGGADHGPTHAGTIGNFAWDRLSLGSGDSLVLQNGLGPAGGALYLNVLDLADGLAQLAGIDDGGFVIYYDPSLAANAYLGGATHALAEGGAVVPLLPRCSDGVDNDGDGLVDAADPGCKDGSWTWEDPACDDGVDNDEDGLVDGDDPECAGAPWRTSEEPAPSCGIGLGLAGWIPGLYALRRRRDGRSA